MRKVLFTLIGTLCLFFGAAFNAHSFSVDGINYTMLSNSTVEVAPPEVISYYGKIVIPETVSYENGQYTVVAIGKYAFANCYCLTEIVLPDGMTQIGDNAFDNCQNLKSIVLPKTLTSIDGCAFRNCRNLKTVSLPESLKKIGEYAFAKCITLTSIVIPGNVAVIPAFGFQECSAITSVTLGQTVSVIDSRAFEKCSSIPSIKIPANVTAINSYAFMDCDKLKTVSFANKDNVKINSSAFLNTPYQKSNNTNQDPRFKTSKTKTVVY